MAAVQIENGYLKIASELAENFAIHKINGQEWQVLWVVIRKTFGFNKVKDQISLTQFCAMTSLNRASVARSIKSLVSKKILGSIKGDTTSATTYWLEKDYDKWIGSIKNVTSIKNDTRGSIISAQKVVSNLIPTINNNTINNNTINTRFEMFWKNYPKKEGKKAAFKHFKATVKKDEDWEKFKKCTEIYLLKIKQENIEYKFIKQASTFVNNWQDWLEYKPESFETKPFDPEHNAKQKQNWIKQGLYDNAE